MKTKIYGAVNTNCEENLARLGEFIGASRIFYKDLGSSPLMGGEDITIEKDGKRMTLQIRDSVMNDGGAFLKTSEITSLNPAL